jgi:GNAT superfamily N-acetyltransferase
LIARLTKENINQITELWLHCFDGTAADVRYFIEYGFVNGLGFGYFRGNELLSMAFLLPGYLVVPHRRVRADYVYAVCTAPTARRQGLSKQLMDYIKDYTYANRRTALCLFPGSDALRVFYARQGFVDAFVRQWDRPNDPPGGFSWTPAMLAYIQSHALRGGTFAEQNSGMLFALRPAAQDFLRQTHARALFPFPLD